MLKKIAAMLLAVTLCAGTLAGCANSDKKDKDSKAASDTTGAEDGIVGPVQGEGEQPLPVASLTVGDVAIDTTDYIMCTIDGMEIDFDEFRFYYFYTLESYKQSYGVTVDTLRENETVYQQFLEDVVMSIEQELITDKLAADNGLELDEEDRSIIDSNIQSAKAAYESEEAFKEDMQRGYMTEELFETLFVRAQTYNKVMETLFANDGIYATSRDDFREIVQDPEQYAREVHIMIPYYSQVELDEAAAVGYDDKTLAQKIGIKNEAYEALDEEAVAEVKAKAKAVADEVLQKALDGEDFYKLVEEYGWDWGLQDPSHGYYMKRDNTGGYPQELLDAAFAIGENEIYGEVVVADEYGCFIVKRLPPDMDDVNDNIDEMITAHDRVAIQEKFAEVMNSMEVTYCDIWDKLTIDSIT